MRELYCVYVDLYSEWERERGLRVKRVLQQIYCTLYLFSLLDNIKGRTSCFFVDVAQTGWTTYICVSLALCVFFVYISAIFYVFHCSVIYNFLTHLQMRREQDHILFDLPFLAYWRIHLFQIFWYQCSYLVTYHIVYDDP